MEQQRDEHGNVVRKEGFTQVCVWPATAVCNCEAGAKPENAAEFEKYLLDELGCRVQYLEEIETLPDQNEDGENVPGTGGRNDVFFAMHKDDITKCAVRRLVFGIRWLEDVLAPINYTSKIYPDRVRQYQTWPQDGTKIPETPATPAEEKLSEVINNISQSRSTQPMKRRNTMSKITDNIRDTLKGILEHKVERAMQEIDLDELVEEALGHGLQRTIEDALQNKLGEAIEDEVKGMVDEVLDEVLDELLDN